MKKKDMLVSLCMMIYIVGIFTVLKIVLIHDHERNVEIEYMQTTIVLNQNYLKIESLHEFIDYRVCDYEKEVYKLTKLDASCTSNV